MAKKLASPRVPITIALPADIRDALRREAARRGGEQSRVIEAAIESFFAEGASVVSFSRTKAPWSKNTFHIDLAMKAKLDEVREHGGPMFGLQNVIYAALLRHLARAD